MDDSQEKLNQKSLNYKYANVQCEYRTESLIISNEEKIEIDKLIQEKQNTKNKINNINFSQINKPKKIIIDTDIGTDVDDVLTLLMALHMPKEDIEVIGITTNYHPALLRKRVAEEIIKSAGPPYDKIPVIAGTSYLCGSHREFFHQGNEGLGLKIPQDQLQQLWKIIDSNEASEFIYNQCKKFPKQVTIVSIGIPTNLGLCAYLFKDFEQYPAHIVVMGGGSLYTKNNFQSQYYKQKHIYDLPDNEFQFYNENFMKNLNCFHLFPNHNISGDTLASKFLFQLNCPISIIPHQITSKYWLKGECIETLLELQDKSKKQQTWICNENSICGSLINEWFITRFGQRGQCPHDPLTLYEATYTEPPQQTFNDKKSCLLYINGQAIVHEWAGYMTFIPNENGNHRIAVGLNFINEWLNWLKDTLINNVPKEHRTTKSNYKIPKPF